MVALKRETVLNEIDGKPAAPGNVLKAKFTIFGEEMIGKDLNIQLDPQTMLLVTGLAAKR